MPPTQKTTLIPPQKDSSFRTVTLTRNYLCFTVSSLQILTRIFPQNKHNYQSVLVRRCHCTFNQASLVLVRKVINSTLYSLCCGHSQKWNQCLNLALQGGVEAAHSQISRSALQLGQPGKVHVLGFNQLQGNVQGHWSSISCNEPTLGTFPPSSTFYCDPN